MRSGVGERVTTIIGIWAIAVKVLFAKIVSNTNKKLSLPQIISLSFPSCSSRLLVETPKAPLTMQLRKIIIIIIIIIAFYQGADSRRTVHPRHNAAMANEQARVSEC